ncbi:MAG: VOC family protein [Bryobacteraceae bacterium]
MAVEPYLFFNGRCEEALRFYEHALGARVETLSRFGDSPDESVLDRLPPGWREKIMHASFLIDGARVMASDGNTAEPAQFRGFALSVGIASEEEARRAFEALGEGGRIDMPFGPTFWSPYFGMVTDRFGVQWMVTAPFQPQA